MLTPVVTDGKFDSALAERDSSVIFKHCFGNCSNVIYFCIYLNYHNAMIVQHV